MFRVGDKVVYIGSSNSIIKYKTYTISAIGYYRYYMYLEGINILETVYKEDIIHLQEYRKRKLKRICLEKVIE